MKKLFLGLAMAALLTPALASAAQWKIDGAHTSVDFKIRHIFTKVSGTFETVSGKIEFDPAHPEKGSVMVTIDAASINTRNEKRDGHLRSPDFFNVEAHPEISFQSTAFKKDGDDLLIEGLLTMNGVENPVVLQTEFLGAGPGMQGGKVAGFEAKTKINRKDWNIEWNRALDQGGTLLGDEVELHISVEAVSESA